MPPGRLLRQTSRSVFPSPFPAHEQVSKSSCFALSAEPPSTREGVAREETALVTPATEEFEVLMTVASAPTPPPQEEPRCLGHALAPGDSRTPEVPLSLSRGDNGCSSPEEQRARATVGPGPPQDPPGL